MRTKMDRQNGIAACLRNPAKVQGCTPVAMSTGPALHDGVKGRVGCRPRPEIPASAASPCSALCRVRPCVGLGRIPRPPTLQGRSPNVPRSHDAAGTAANRPQATFHSSRPSLASRKPTCPPAGLPCTPADLSSRNVDPFGPIDAPGRCHHLFGRCGGHWRTCASPGTIPGPIPAVPVSCVMSRPAGRPHVHVTGSSGTEDSGRAFHRPRRAATVGRRTSILRRSRTEGSVPHAPSGQCRTMPSCPFPMREVPS
jgi:hypothetical protein